MEQIAGIAARQKSEVRKQLAIIEIRNISKSFPGVKALSDVSLSIEEGEVHAIVGENGAGKSTLMKILGGMYQADSGEIFIRGEKQEIHSIQDAMKAGVSVIYQELNLMPELTVAENIFASGLPVHGVVLDIRTMNARAQELIDSMNLSLKPTDMVGMLSVSQQQMVEIAKAISHESDIIIMDEPTGALNNQEVDVLYALIRRLKENGKTILYISHRLKEIFDLTDRVSILRDGQYVATKRTEELTHNDLVKLMVGREVDQYYKSSGHALGETVLEVKNLTRAGMFEDVSFSVRSGELLGVAGLMGCGREEIVKAIYGLIRPDGGTVTLGGRQLQMKGPLQAIRDGIGFVTEDRKSAGIFALMTVRENLTMNILRSISRFGLISDAKEQELLENYKKRMNMKFSSPAQRIVNLSGGNQQKFLLARALASDCKVLIMLEPTRGIDVGAKAEIYELLEELAKSGLAIIVVSSELPEIISICHRTLVVFQGRITGNLSKTEMDEVTIMECATGTSERLDGDSI